MKKPVRGHIVSTGNVLSAGRMGSLISIWVHLYSPTLEIPLLDRLEREFSEWGFVYRGGGELPDDTTYPYKQHRYQEYWYIIERSK